MRLLPLMAIARLTVRDAARSRLLVSLAAILVTGLIGLPLLISGDNTLNGQIQVVLTYTLSFAMSILSAVTLWAACGGIASEIQDRRLYLVLTRPVHRHELWLGKWLGIAGLNAMLLGLTGLIVSAMIAYTLNVSPESAVVKRQAREHFLLARMTVFPVAPDFSEQARREADALFQSGRLPSGVTARNVEGQLIKRYQDRRYSLPPHGAITLDYPLPVSTDDGHDLILKYAFDSSRPERTPVPGEWTMSGGKHDSLVMSVTNYPGLPNTVLIPGEQVRGAPSIHLTYQRLDSQNPATLLLKAHGKEPELLVPAGGVAMNLTRGLLIILFRLGFLAALGLTAGSLLSMPVAVFAGFFIMTLLALSGYVETVASSGVFYVAHEGPAPTQIWLDAAILNLFKGLYGITRPFLRFDPVPLLQEGLLISWSLAGQAFAWLIGLYTTLTALIGIALFNRRELG